MTYLTVIERHPPCLLCGNREVRRAHSKQFEEYVKEHCPGYSLAQAKRLVHEGETFVESLQRGRKIVCGDPMDKMAPFMWYLMYQAIVSKQAFSQGTFILKDSGHKFEKFFTKSSSCYRRWMSHFPGRTKTDHLLAGWHNTNGMDINQDATRGLPAHKRTVIWTRLKTIEKGKYTFFKIEDWGFTGWEAKLRHFHDWLWILPGKVAPSWYGKHYKRHFREEYLPPDIYKKYHNLMKEKGIKHTGRDVTKFGLSAIVHSLRPFSKKCEKSKALLHELYNAYPDLAFAKVRTGREVIFHHMSRPDPY